MRLETRGIVRAENHEYTESREEYSESTVRAKNQRCSDRRYTESREQGYSEIRSQGYSEIRNQGYSDIRNQGYSESREPGVRWK